MTQFANPEVAGAAGGALQQSLLLTTPAVPAGVFPLTVGTIGPIDVTAFQAVIFTAQLSATAIGAVVLAPEWTDANANVVAIGPSGFANPMVLPYSTLPQAVSLTCVYRNMGPFLTINITQASGTFTGGTLRMFGTNIQPRFDGPYTPSMSGAILASPGSVGIGQQIILTAYTGPAYVDFGVTFTTQANAIIASEDANNVTHIIAHSTELTQVGISVGPQAFWLPATVNRIIGGNVASPNVTVVAA